RRGQIEDSARRTGRGKGFGDPPAQSARAAGDQTDPAGEESAHATSISLEPGSAPNGAVDGSARAVKKCTGVRSANATAASRGRAANIKAREWPLRAPTKRHMRARRRQERGPARLR